MLINLLKKRSRRWNRPQNINNDTNIGVVAKKVGVSDVVKGGGYWSLVNVGENGGQEVPHLHFHIFGGE